MRQEIIDLVSSLTEEEEKILADNSAISKELYTSEDEFVVDSAKLLEKGKLIAMRLHTRFAYFPEHRHNYIEMLLMLKGSLTTAITEGDTLTLHEGDILLMNRHARHEIMPCGRDDLAVNIIILPEFFSRSNITYDRENILRDFIITSLSDKKGFRDYLVYHAKGLISVENLTENLIWTLATHSDDMNRVAQSTLDLLLMNLGALSSDTLKDMSSRGQNITVAALEYIDKNYKDGTLSELASNIGYSTAYLSRLLKSTTGHNFKELLQQRKLKQAAYFLENTTLTVERIMDSIGYDNSTYFFGKFNEIFGCSPKEYRKKHIK
ncbi:MAG: helix-turn-helix domain-containing protein [Lachnospiraceae bacterium]|nr:helix-turn-helix domain-containing protein [Lachnospiraceae bacterium]